MINKSSVLFKYFVLLIPISLITGPAVPDILISLTGIFFLTYVFINKDYKRIIKNNLFKTSLIFWLYILFVSFFAENQNLSFRDSSVFFRILLIPFVLYYWFSENIKFLEKILFIIFLCIFFVVIDTLFQFTQYTPEYGFGKDLLGFKSTWYGRLTGPFGNDELIPGAYLARFSFLGLLFILIKIQNKKYLYFISFFYLTLTGLAIFSTGERMALATYLMALVFLFIFYSKKRKIFLSTLIALPILFFLTQKIHPIYNDYTILESTPYHLGLKIEKNITCNNEKADSCKKIINLQPSFISVIKDFQNSAYGEIYKVSIKMFMDNKFLGIGLNNFMDLCNKKNEYRNLMINYDCATHPHNIYIQWLAETGIIGLIIFIIYLFVTVNSFFGKNYNEFSFIACTPILIMFWPIMSTGSLLNNWNGVSTFFIIGICLSIKKFKIKN